MLIFEKSQAQRVNRAQLFANHDAADDIPAELLRSSDVMLPEVSELQVVRHYTQLSQHNAGIDTTFYPLGSCTMKYNPRGVQRAVSHENFLQCHPLLAEQHCQGVLACLYQLQQYLQQITGMSHICLSSMAGSQGEFAGVAMIRAYHLARGDTQRNEIIVPDAAHGTNPASAVMCGFKVKEVPTAKDGDIDMIALQGMLGPKTGGIMLTNPSTLGLFLRKIKTVADMVHQAGGLLYYDGANLNAILGKVRPGDMGFDVVHLNLHKTFATPHGGGGPGAGPIGVSKRLEPFLPTPLLTKNETGYHWLKAQDRPQSIGRLSTFHGNVGILLRAYAYIRLLGRQGLPRVAEHATLNANYLRKKLSDVGYHVVYQDRIASHEFVISLKKEKHSKQLTALDVAKRLIAFGYHPPTVYFPLLIEECLLIEPTETESKQTLDKFIDTMQKILENIPGDKPISRFDEVKAARELQLVYREHE